MKKLLATTALAVLLGACSNIANEDSSTTTSDAGNSYGGMANAPVRSDDFGYYDTADQQTINAFSSTTEYQRNRGLGLMNVAQAYARGLSGLGVKVGVVDTGFATNGSSGASDLVGKLDYASKDIKDSRNNLSGSSKHGAAVASIIAGKKNGNGMQGVAYDSSIVAVRADTCATSASGSSCNFDANDLAKAIRYAADQDIKILNLSLGGPSLSDVELSAIQYAIDKGILIFAAAGNNGDINPLWPAQLSAYKAAKGRIIAVGALNGAGSDIASFSNKAGVAKNYYLLAPGENVSAVTGDNNEISLISGTSFASPHAAGIAALILSGADHLTAEQLATIMLTTATDMGSSGVDNTYGWGQINLAEALKPYGSSSLALGTTVNGSSAPLSASGLTLPLAFGALNTSALAKAAFFDSFGRQFKSDLSYLVKTAKSGLDFTSWNSKMQQQSYSFDLSKKTNFALTQYSLKEDAIPSLDKKLQDIKGLKSEQYSFKLATKLNDRSKVLAGSGYGLGELLGFNQSAYANELNKSRLSSPFLSLTETGNNAVLNHKLDNNFSLFFGLGLGESGLDNKSLNKMLLAGAEYKIDSKFKLQVHAGQVNESQALLGGFASGAFSFGKDVKTSFVGLGLEKNLSDNFKVSAQYNVGYTKVEGDNLSYLRDFSNLRSSSLSFNASMDKLLNAKDNLTLTVAQPFRIDQGSAAWYVPTGRTTEGGLLIGNERTSLTPTGREWDIFANYSMGLTDVSSLSFLAGMQINPGHDQQAATNYLAGFNFQTKF